MTVLGKTLQIGRELRSHAPFTLLGAATGVGLMLAFRDMTTDQAQILFAVFHPTHVVLSAMVTAALFRLRRSSAHFLHVLLIGYFGAVGVATLSDCVVPYVGETLLGVAVPIHGPGDRADHHRADPAGQAMEDRAGAGGETGPHLHLGFIEEWYLVNPAAVLGVLIAFLLPRTRTPHMFHVLMSTWASSAHVLMNTHAELSPSVLVGFLVVLFIAVWLPCCISDIVFPMLFVDSEGRGHCPLCHDHTADSLEAGRAAS